MKAVIGAPVAALLSASLALAADLPMKAPPLAPPIVYSWAGWYVGANVGYGWGTQRDPLILTNTPGASVTTGGLRPDGVFGGVQAGYNWQFTRLVLGVEADIQGSDIKDSFARIIDAGGDNLSARQSLRYFGTVRGRLGYVLGPVLLYATGGYAYGNVRDRLLVSNSPLSANLNADQTKSGSVVGGGAEWLINKAWSVKGEYQYIQLERLALIAPVLPANGIIVSSNAIKDHFQTVRIGLNYHFNWDPIVARY